MKDCILKLENPSYDVSRSLSLKSILGVNSEYSSSNESLLTLLNATIEHQQAHVKSLSQSTMSISMSKHRSKQLNEDEELEMFAYQDIQNKLRDIKSEQDEPPKKKNKKHKDREGNNSSKREMEAPTLEVLPQEHEKRGRKHAGISEVEQGVFEHKEKSKMKKHKAEMENLERKQAESPEISMPVFDEPGTSHKKSKRRNQEHCDYEKTTKEGAETSSSKKSKRKKKPKHSSVSEVQQDGEENDASENKENTKTKKRKKSNLAEMENLERITSGSPEISVPVFHEPGTSLKKSKKRKQEHSEAEVNDEKTTKEGSETSSSKKSKQKKKHKHSSVSEAEQDGEKNVDNENKPKTKTKKHKESNLERIISESPEISMPVFDEPSTSHYKSRKRKQEHSSTSEAEVNYEKTAKEGSDNSSSKKSKGKKNPKHSSASETEQDGEKNVDNENKQKTKTKKHEESNLERIISESPEINVPVFDEPGTSHNKSRKRKQEHSSISEAEVNYEKTAKEGSENSSSKKSKQKKNHKHSSASEAEQDGEKNIDNENKQKTKTKNLPEMKNRERVKPQSPEKSVPVFDEPGTSHKKSKQRRQEHSSISEGEDGAEEKKKKTGRPNTESASSMEEITKVKQENSFSKAGGDSENLQLATSGSNKADEVKSKKRPKKSTSKQNSSLKPSLLDKMKSNHDKYYLKPKPKSESNEDEDMQDPNKSKMMDFINEALDTALEKKQLNDVDVSYLKNLSIVVPWELPESHTIETRLSHPTNEQYKMFKELDITMKSGPYNKGEDEKIKDNWTEFCRDHDLEISASAFLPAEGETRSILPTKQRLNLVRYLGRGLQNRTLASIYNRFGLLFSPFKKGKFTPKEDDIILAFIEHSPVSNKYSALSQILNRGRELIRKRHAVLKSDDEKFSWTMSLLQDLVNNLLEVAGEKDVDDIKEFPFEMAHWKSVERMMGIPALKIRRKWELYLYPRLFVDEYNTLNEVREEMINILYRNKEDDRKNVNWNQLAQSCGDGMTGARVYKIFLDMLEKYVPEKDRTNFRDTITCLKSTLPHMHRRTKALTKFVHRNGQLYDSKLLEPSVTF